MYLLGRAGGYRFQKVLWQMYMNGDLVIHDVTPGEVSRMRELMETYHDAPMDLADASVVAMVEVLSTQRVFTIDTHFYAYRTKDGKALEVVS
jgi:predicted nucleic acid-binding protein